MKPRWSAAVLVLALVSMCPFTKAQLKASDKTDATPQPVMFDYTEVIERFLFTVDHVSRTSENPTSSAIAAAMEANAILSNKPYDAINYFNRTLPDVKNDAVRRVIRLQLAELYRQTDQPDKALEQLRELMILAPASAPHATRTQSTRELPSTPHPKPEASPNE